jgi:hypothetical protein
LANTVFALARDADDDFSIMDQQEIAISSPAVRVHPPLLALFSSEWDLVMP